VLNPESPFNSQIRRIPPSAGPLRVEESFKPMNQPPSEENKPKTPAQTPKKRLRSFRFAEPLPPDHPIYQEGPQFTFVSALPASIKAAQQRRKSSE